MSHCLLKEQDIVLFKFFSVSFIFFEIKKISKKKKKCEKKFSQLKKYQHSINVSLRQCHYQTMAGSN